MDHSPHILPHFLHEKLGEITELCEKHKLRRLWVFGSVIRSDFDQDSDIDLLYEMDDANILPEESYQCFWGFYDSMRSLLDRPVDMVWYQGIRNPYFKAEVDETKLLIYDKRGEKVSV